MVLGFLLLVAGLGGSLVFYCLQVAAQPDVSPAFLSNARQCQWSMSLRKSSEQCKSDAIASLEVQPRDHQS